MKNLGKVLVNGAKLAIAGYVGYKVIEEMKKKQEVKEEEYVNFDDLEIVEEQPSVDVKKVVMIAGGVALVNTILKQNNKINKLTKQVNENHDLIMKLGEVVDVNSNVTQGCIQDMCALADEACKIAAVNFGELDIRLGRLERK